MADSGLLSRAPGSGLLGTIDWQALMALGAGIASKSGQGWGPGIGTGLALASETVSNNRKAEADRLYREGLLQQQQANAAALGDYRNASLGLREREVASSDAYRQAQIENLQNPAAKIGATVESIRAKLARGETLTPGENKVYEDVLRTDYLTKLLMGGGAGGGIAPQPAPTPQAAAPSLAPNTPDTDPRRQAAEQAPMVRQVPTTSIRAPSQASIDYLAANRNNPAIVQQFDQQFGQGAAMRFLGGQ